MDLFGDMLKDADAENRRRVDEAKYSGQSCSWAEAVERYRSALRKHDAAMRALDFDGVDRAYNEAREIAVAQNKGTLGVGAQDGAGARLSEATSADLDADPLWGQAGTFHVTVLRCRVRISWNGLMSIGGNMGFGGPFYIHAVDWQKPFFSETGFRSFLGCSVEPTPRLSPASFVERTLSTHFEKEMRGRLVTIDEYYQSRGENR